MKVKKWGDSYLLFFLKTGTTLAVLRAEGKVPVWIERLKIFAKISEISTKTVLRIVFGILQGPVDLGPCNFIRMDMISEERIGRAIFQ